MPLPEIDVNKARRIAGFVSFWRCERNCTLSTNQTILISTLVTCTAGHDSPLPIPTFMAWYGTHEFFIIFPMPVVFLSVDPTTCKYWDIIC